MGWEKLETEKERIEDRGAREREDCKSLFGK